MNSPDSARGRATQGRRAVPGGVITAFLILILAAGQPARAGEAPRIEVFVTEAFLPLKNTQGATVYGIDGLARIEVALSRELPGDPKAARALVLARLARMETGLGQQLEHAAKGLARAMQYGIDRYPAIVFDGQAVVYGVHDIEVASQHWYKWKKAQARQ